MEKKKKYQRPIVQTETFAPETGLCSCAVVNKRFSEATQCGYELEGLGVKVFAQGWADCQMSDISGGFHSYCYMPGANNLFSS